MANIVTAVGITHNPRVYWSKKEPPPADRDAILSGFAKLRSQIESSNLDALVIIADDHVDTFFEDNMPAFCIGIGDEALGPASMEEEMGIPHYRCAVNSELASYLLRFGVHNRFDLSWTKRPDVDHAFIVPLTFVAPKMNIPIVPVFANDLVPPIPEPGRFFELGKMIKEAIIGWPKPARVGVMASFTLSNEVGGPKGGSRDKEFNDEAIRLMTEGRSEEIVNRCTLQRLFKAGNSTPEFLNYVALLGVVGNKKPDFITYRDAPLWGGCASVAWNF